MDPEDFFSPEVGITAAVAAVVASPRLRKAVRRGAVFSVAGVLMAGDAATSFIRGLSQGASQDASSTSNGHQHPERRDEPSRAKESS